MSTTVEIGREEHERLAKHCFNRAWDLLLQAERTDAETERMIHTAHASAYHWLHAGGPTQFARGAWQLARVYAVAGRPEEARRHGERCLQWCESDQLSAFDHGYAHEALARAALVDGDIPRAEAHLERAIEALGKIEDAEDRALLEKDLAELREKVRARG